MVCWRKPKDFVVCVWVFWSLLHSSSVLQSPTRTHVVREERLVVVVKGLLSKSNGQKQLVLGQTLYKRGRQCYSNSSNSGRPILCLMFSSNAVMCKKLQFSVWLLFLRLQPYCCLQSYALLSIAINGECIVTSIWLLQFMLLVIQYRVVAHGFYSVWKI